MDSLPEIGVVHWPVGTGDSTTIAVSSDIVMQVDLHHMKKADDDEEPAWQVIDELVGLLPQVDGEPYLAVFALTHADLDHCKGFADLLDQVNIGELWFTPRIFEDTKEELCEDAKAFQAEAKRRVKATIDAEGEPDSGDRVRIVGWADILKKGEFDGFPESKLSIPGNEVTDLDGEDCSSTFTAFLHAPFKKDTEDGERNDSSLAMQVTLTNGENCAKYMLLGDLAYESLKRIFDETDDAAKVAWNVFLAPHHCSKKVMYTRNAETGVDELQQDIMTLIENAALTPAYVISSSDPVPKKNSSGDNPPHAKAKNRYLDMNPTDFLCTMERPTAEAPEPIVLEVGPDGLSLEDVEAEDVDEEDLKAAIAKARGGSAPPTGQVGFGDS